MSINLTLPTGSIGSELKPRITVIGVGGAGGNAVNNMIQSGLEGVEFLVANSDAQALALSKSEHRIQMGTNITQGLGAGANPDIGQAAAEESLEEIISHIKDANMLFITAGLGGGTGTGAAPVIAKAAREYGILTVGVVTKPFQFEGANRMKMAEAGLDELQQYVDTLLIIPNQNLFRVANEKTTFADAFKMADDVLYSGVRGVTDLMVMPGLINLDFADIKSVMSEMGKAMMGTGEAEGERRATEAAEQAIANPLLDDTSMSGAKGVLINITAGTDITLFEVDEAANRIRDEVDGEVNIIFGSTFDETLEGRVRVSVVATGISSIPAIKSEPTMRPIAEIMSSQKKVLDEIPEVEQKTQPILQNIKNVSKEEQKVKESFDHDFESSNNAILRQINASDIPQISDKEGTKIKEELVLEEDKIPDFLSEAGPVEDVFIPLEPSDGLISKTSVDTFAAADMINGSKEATEPKPPKKTSGLSLFERVTGVSRGNKKPVNKVVPDIIETEGQEVNMLNSASDISTNQTEYEIEDIISKETTKPEPFDNEEINSGVHLEHQLNTSDGEAIEPTIKMSHAKNLESEPESIENNSANSTEAGLEDPQSLLGDLDPADRLAGAQDEDGTLDIPAFLRRQAN
jgi:cell division protein FtsZ